MKSQVSHHHVKEVVDFRTTAKMVQHGKDASRVEQRPTTAYLSSLWQNSRNRFAASLLCYLNCASEIRSYVC
jgi:hypothetical protein